ncbi:hypothetical protein PIB30_038385 [Stylosanthes scabra]|uniref:Pectinesterase inhibitor domain-containing protein n=1 Tax=Stylosanthes scabra TaxID=79078 RepID=A0ABU6SF97_9FABA|nr:hypothetical protein [Stylosanthes scabra]
MASHSVATFVLLFTYFFLLPFSSASSSTTHEKIHSICAQTENPNFCVNSLVGFLGDKKADTNELAIVSILLATAQARMNKYVVEHLMQSVDDPRTKNVLSMCDMDYGVALKKLQDAYVLSDHKDYRGMIDLVNDAVVATNDCTNGWKQLRNPPPSSSSLKDDNLKMVWFNNIAFVTLIMLNNK